MRICQRWFALFKSGGFDIENKTRSDEVKKFENVEVLEMHVIYYQLLHQSQTSDGPMTEIEVFVEE